MKILYFGGQKSGKSKLAEAKALSLSKQQPIYIATYDDSFDDVEMQKRILNHQNQRANKFTTICELKDLTKVIKPHQTYLIDCISMWILNTLDISENILLSQLETLSQIDTNIIFVLNDVNSGVIPLDKISRKYVDRSGIIGQKIASFCDAVFEVKFGLKQQLK